LDQLLKSWPFDPWHLVFRTSGVHDLALISQSSTSRNWKKNHSCQGRKAGWSTTLRARCSLEYIPAGRQHSPGRRPLWSLPCEILGKMWPVVFVGSLLSQTWNLKFNKMMEDYF
jgi:hypothetical protein